MLPDAFLFEYVKLLHQILITQFFNMALASKQIATQHLVLTAIGQNKTGLVSELTGLITQCNCNVLDSKMAIFGSEFTMIMLLAGDNSSLLELEVNLPPLAMQLNLLTMMKRTTTHEELERPQYLVQIDGPDQTGTIKKLTSYLAKNQIDIASLKSNTMKKNGDLWQVAEINIDLPDQISPEQLKRGLAAECKVLNMNCTINPITINELK